jgi:Zn-dependent M28 family amino/carboxypeptidase
MAFFVREGALAILEQSPGDRGDSGSVRVQGPAAGEGSREPGGPPVLPQLVLAAEHYGRIARTLETGLPVALEMDVRNRFHDDQTDAFNIVADLPGSGGRDELVMLGAHFDSWHAGTGATDNGGSSALILEAMRLLRASGLEVQRTVRAVLWTGEEQGLLGSRAYVRRHFGDPSSMTLTPGHGKLAAYFNVDNGGGAFRGVYLQGNEQVAPVFRAWMAPFAHEGMTTLAARNTRGTDHVAFDEVGLPGFQFVQDPLEYYSRSHHTNLDLYERLVADDLKKNAVVLAAFAYHAANRAERLPRKPLPPPRGTPGARPPASATGAGR